MQRRITDLDGELLPSDVVGTPEPPGLGFYALAVALILWIGVAMADICALLWYVWDFLATICGKPPPRCTQRCRVIVDKNAVPRALCTRQCCFPCDHGSAWNHCCEAHAKFGGKLSRQELKTWAYFSWLQRIWSKARRLGANTCILLSKWRVLRWAAVGILFALWYTVLAGPPTTSGFGGRYTHSPPRLALTNADEYVGPYDIIGMMQG